MKKVQKLPPEVMALSLTPAPPAIKVAIIERKNKARRITSYRVKYLGKFYAWQATRAGCAGCVFWLSKSDACRIPMMFPSCLVHGENGIYKREAARDTKD